MKKDFYTLPEIQYGKHPKVLLVGNGVNLPFDGAKKTDEIIKQE